jgi:hypothetical protein
LKLASVKLHRRTDYINWDKEVFPSVDKRIRESERQRVKPIRNGTLPIDCVADNTRHIIDIRHYQKYGRALAEFDEKLQTLESMYTPRPHIASGISYFDDTINAIYNNIPRWLNQPKYVEVFVEKDAMAASISSILDNGDEDSAYGTDARHVVVVPNRGWSFASSHLARSQGTR